MTKNEARIDQMERAERQRIVDEIMLGHLQLRKVAGVEPPGVDVGDNNMAIRADLAGQRATEPRTTRGAGPHDRGVRGHNGHADFSGNESTAASSASQGRVPKDGRPGCEGSTA